MGTPHLPLQPPVVFRWTLLAGLAFTVAALGVADLRAAFVAASLVLGGVVIARPVWGLYAALAVAPLHVYRHEFGPMNLSLFRVLVGLMALGVLLDCARSIRSGGRPASALRPLRSTAIIMALFLAFDAWQISRGVTGLGETVFGQRLLFLASILVIAASARHLAASPQSLVAVTIASSAAPFALALFQWATGESVQALPFQSLIAAPESLDVLRSGGYAASGIRPAGTFSDPNFLALFAALTFVLADTATAARGPFPRWLLVTAQLLCVAIVIITESRTGFATLVGYLVVSRLAALWNRRKRAIFVLASVAAIAAAVAVMVFADVTLGRGDPAASTQRHFETRVAALGIGLTYPFAGIGLGNVGMLLGEAPDRSSAHALPFTLFAEEGLLGLSLGMLALGWPLLSPSPLRSDLRLRVGIAIAIALWLYDFAFVLDVAAVWWALCLIPSSPPGSRRPADESVQFATATRG